MARLALLLDLIVAATVISLGCCGFDTPSLFSYDWALGFIIGGAAYSLIPLFLLICPPIDPGSEIESISDSE